MSSRAEAGPQTQDDGQTLVVERHGPVGWLIFNRPGSANAMNAAMLDGLEAAWRELDADPAVRVIVNTGAGRAFQTGLDMVELAKDPDALREQSRRTKRAELRLTAWHNRVWKPVIAAVNGVCAGGGLHFVADADIVMASSNATFLDPHVSVGQVTAYEAIGLLRKMPVEAVMRMALVGRYERIDAQRAYQLGMISQIVDPPEQLREAAQELAEKIAKNSPAAMAATKRALWGALELGLTDACKAGAKELVAMWGHPDQEEGPRAFAEKREARWVEPGASAPPK
jgi:enoyl-CoA hydratase/carnithine racemase